MVRSTWRFKGRCLVVGVAAACSFVHGRTPSDVPPDAGPCRDLGSSCASSSTLRTCAAVGELAVDTQCVWGCLSMPEAHCGELVPSGGAVVPEDLQDPTGLMPTTLTGTKTIDGTTGTITNTRTANADPDVYEVKSNIGFVVRNGVGIFKFTDLRIEGTLNVRGSNAVALVALGSITVTGLIDAKGDCTGSNAGPGGYKGGASGSAGDPATGGGGSSDGDGGGGGGHGATGGSGGSAGGAVFGDEVIAMLRGGAGGGGDRHSSSTGGGGGGALQFVATGSVLIDAIDGGIDAGGCGGGRGTGDGDCDGGGGGGGAGGAILIEAPAITRMQGGIAVNGGGGGGRSGDGSNATISMTPALGGISGSTGGSGGSGAAATDTSGFAGITVTSCGGGGGGAAGRIRFNTATGAITEAGGFVSPPLGMPTTTQGIPQLR